VVLLRLLAQEGVSLGGDRWCIQRLGGGLSWWFSVWRRR